MEALHWYAYKIYHNRLRFIREQAEQAGWECFVPMRRRLRSADYNLSDEEATVCEPVISSLLFIRSNDAYMTSLRRDPNGRAGVYCLPGTNEPAVIPDKEMGFFIFALTRDCDIVEAVDLNFKRGDRVRVTEGMMKGAEGYIARVKGTRRFVVVVEGVAAVATSYIPQRFLEKIS